MTIVYLVFRIKKSLSDYGQNGKVPVCLNILFRNHQTVKETCHYAHKDQQKMKKIF